MESLCVVALLLSTVAARPDPWNQWQKEKPQFPRFDGPQQTAETNLKPIGGDESNPGSFGDGTLWPEWEATNPDSPWSEQEPMGEPEFDTDFGYMTNGPGDYPDQDGRWGRPNGGRPESDRPGRPNGGRPGGDRPGRPNGGRPGRPNGGRPESDRPGRPNGGRPESDRPGRPNGGRPESDRPGRPNGGRPNGGRPNGGRPGGDKPGRPNGGRPNGGRPNGGRPEGRRPNGGRPEDGRPDMNGRPDRMPTIPPSSGPSGGSDGHLFESMVFGGKSLHPDTVGNRDFIPLFKVDNVTLQNVDDLHLKEGENIFLLPKGGTGPPPAQEGQNAPLELQYGYPQGLQPYIKIGFNPAAEKKITFEYGLMSFLNSYG